MKDDSLPISPLPTQKTEGRRQFLQGAGVAAGALVLTRVLPAQAQETAPDGAAANAPAPTETTTILRLDEHKDLQTVGGYEVIEMGADKVIVARTETGFVACSAICTHRGCTVAYKSAEKQFACPCHGARFDETGKVTKGPARTDLKAYDIANALVVKNR